MKKNKKKILILTEDLSNRGGWGRYSVDLIRELQEEFEVSVICREAPPPEVFKDVSFCEVLPLPTSFLRCYFFAPWYVWRSRRMIESVDIVHVFVEPYSFIGYLFSVISGARYALTAHGTYGVLPFSFPFWKRYFHRSALSRADLLVCVSRYTANKLSHFGVTERVMVINNGVLFKDHADFGHEVQKENMIISVGMLKRRKGYETSLRAFAEVRKVHPEFIYVIVGNQSDQLYYSRLKQLVSELGLDDSVNFRDRVDDIELDRLYSRARVFVLTPQSEAYRFEGFGLVYLEAGMYGLPVVGCRGSGAEDAIRNGITGFLVEQGDVSATARAILSLVDDPRLAERMGKLGHSWAKEHDWAIIAQTYSQAYRRLLS